MLHTDVTHWDVVLLCVRDLLWLEILCSNVEVKQQVANRANQIVTLRMNNNIKTALDNIYLKEIHQ